MDTEFSRQKCIQTDLFRQRSEFDRNTVSLHDARSVIRLSVTSATQETIMAVP